MAKRQNKSIKVAKPTVQPGLNICVFCSANELPEKFTKPAEKLAKLIAEHGHNLVWGGSDVGLMKIMASGAQAGGAKIIGVSVDFLKHKLRANADEMIIAKDLGERKAKMLERSDIIVLLIGGTGTLDEVTEIIEHKKHGHHDKPIIVLNTDNFYDGLKLQFLRMKDEGMLTSDLDRLVSFAETPEEVINQINLSRLNDA